MPDSKPTARKFSGPGAAHTSWRMFGARGIHLSPEDGGGGSSAPPAPAGGAAPAGDPAPSPSSAPKTFTQDQLDTIVQERLARDRQARTQPAPAQTPAQPQPDEQQMTPRQMREALSQLTAQVQFRDLADEIGVPRELRGDLFDLSQVQKPQDMRAWMETKAKSYGARSNPSSQPAPQDPPKPPAAAPSAPNRVDPVDANGLVNIFALSDQQIAQMSPAAVRGHFDKILDHARSQSGAPPVPRPQTRKG